MYRYLIGKITEIDPKGITLEINNVGYFIKCGNPFKYKKHEEKKLFIYQYVREDEISLFGFDKSSQLELFLQLINVKGLGCKMALPLLEANDNNELITAIESGNIEFLKKFPKIGDKLARQIILDLKGKLIEQAIEDEDLIAALLALGYKKSSIKSILRKIDNHLSIDEKIKMALKLL